MRVFIVEDDQKIRKELSFFLSSYGYETIASETFEHVTEDILSSKAHIVLLDVNLPMFDGYYICREVRKQSNIPIIIVTSRDSEIDELMSMNLGADDFITKPYNTQILLARISSLLKRTYHSEASNLITHNDVTLNLSAGKISFNEKEAELTKNEMKILHLLMASRGSIVSRDEIMNALWQSDEFVDDNTLTVNVNRLRKKLEEIGVKDFLKTKRGQGYLI